MVIKKKLTAAEFEQVIKTLDVGEQTQAIARGVLVDGKPQKDFVIKFGVTKGAVWQAVNRVWTAYVAYEKRDFCCQSGFETVCAVLPRRQAFIVKKWAEEARAKVDQKEKK